MRDFSVTMALLVILVFAACTTPIWQLPEIEGNSSKEFPLIQPDHSVPPRGAAREADQFVETIGVNFHFTAGKNYATESKARLAELGIRHVRGSLARAMSAKAKVQSLHQQLGIKYVFYVGAPNFKSIDNGDHMTGAEAHDAILSLGLNLVDAIGGPNEPENVGSGTKEERATVMRSYMMELYGAIKGDPRTAGVKVFSPAISAGGVGKMDVAIGNIDHIIDGTIAHAYPKRTTGGNHFPEDPDGPLLHALNSIGTMGSFSKPFLSTETGYPTQPVNPIFPKPETTVAIYMPRLYLTLFNHGVSYAHAYEWLDSGTGGSDSQTNYGYLHSDYSPKPHFYAIRNMIRLLEDPGARFATTSLNYTLSGNMLNVQEVLLEKRDGSYYLAVWIGKELDLNNPTSTNLTLNLPQPMASIATARPNDTDRWTTVGSGSSVHLTVDEKVLLVKLVPSSP